MFWIFWPESLGEEKNIYKMERKKYIWPLNYVLLYIENPKKSRKKGELINLAKIFLFMKLPKLTFLISISNNLPNDVLFHFASVYKQFFLLTDMAWSLVPGRD